MLDAVSDETLIVVDEAHAEYAEGDDYASSLPFLSKRDQPWIVLRTFSKAFGLTGLRIGFGIVGDPELRALLDHVRTPFNANGMAQAAALAALADEEHLARVVTLAKAERARVENFLTSKGLEVAASRGNFLFFIPVLQLPATVDFSIASIEQLPSAKTLVPQTSDPLQDTLAVRWGQLLTCSLRI